MPVKLVVLFALLFCNTITVNGDGGLVTGLLIGSALSSGHNRQQPAALAAPVDNAIMLRLRACTVWHGPNSYNTTTGTIQVLVRQGAGCEDSKYKEVSINEFLSDRFPGYKSYSIQPGRHEIFLFVVP